MGSPSDESTLPVRRISRRAILAPLTCLVAAPVLGMRAQAETADEPPVFETARSQFTLVEPSTSLPKVTLTDLNGRHTQLAPVSGKVLLINVWATWCEACRFELPLLEHFQATMGSHVKVAAVSVDKADRKTVGAYLERLSIRHLAIYLDPDGLIAGSAGGTAAALPLYKMPMTYLIAPSGRIAGYIAGTADWLAPEGQALLAYYAGRD